MPTYVCGDPSQCEHVLANIHKLVSMEFGDTAAGFSRADRVYEDLFFYEGSTHLPPEQPAAAPPFTTPRLPPP